MICDLLHENIIYPVYLCEVYPILRVTADFLVIKTKVGRFLDLIKYDRGIFVKNYIISVIYPNFYE